MDQSNPAAMSIQQMRSTILKSDHKGGAHPNIRLLSSSDQYSSRSNDDTNDNCKHQPIEFLYISIIFIHLSFLPDDLIFPFSFTFFSFIFHVYKKTIYIPKNTKDKNNSDSHQFSRTIALCCLECNAHCIAFVYGNKRNKKMKISSGISINLSETFFSNSRHQTVHFLRIYLKRYIRYVCMYVNIYKL